MGDPKRGLYEKFEIQRTDGSHKEGGKNFDCQFLVLDLTHDKHALPALQAYVESLRATGEYSLLRIDLENKLMEKGYGK